MGAAHDEEAALKEQLAELQSALETIKEAEQQSNAPDADLLEARSELEAGIRDVEARLLQAAKARLLQSLASPAPPQQPTTAGIIPNIVLYPPGEGPGQQRDRDLENGHHDLHVGGDASEDSGTGAVLAQLRAQLGEQREALRGIEAALSEQQQQQGSNGGAADVAELQQIAEQLRAGICETKESIQGLGGSVPVSSDSSGDSGSDMDVPHSLSSSSHSSSDGSESEKSEGEGEGEACGLGSRLDVMSHARLSLAAGINRDTAHFAQWEAHTRGIASKLMARMGYVAGQGLGVAGRGITEPVEALLMAPQVGLGHEHHTHRHRHKHRHKHKQGEGNGGGTQEEGEGEGSKKKRSRGGERSRKRKHRLAQAAAREARRDEEHTHNDAPETSGVFRFINTSLGDQGAASVSFPLPSHRTNTAQNVPRTKGAAPAKADSRQRLMDQNKRIDACQAKVSHFKAMLARNKTNVTLAPQIAANLKAAEAELAAAQAEQARMAGALKAADAQKKSIKF